MSAEILRSVEIFSQNGTGFDNHSWGSLQLTGTTKKESKMYDYQMEYPDYTQDIIVQNILATLLIMEGFIGILGNFCICFTIIRNKCLHSPINYYILNLGVCDFIIAALVLPSKLFELTANAEIKTMNIIWCTGFRFWDTIVIFASIFTLVAICLERYNAVVKPVQSKLNIRILRVRKVLTFVWLLSVILATPNLYPATPVSYFLYSKFGKFSRRICYDGFSDEFRFYYFMFCFVFVFMMPLGLIGLTSFCIARVLLQPMQLLPRASQSNQIYENCRKTVAKMILAVAFTFWCCWSPYFIVTAVSQLQNENFLQKGQFFFTMMLINLLAFAHSCLNPLLYFSMSTKFRKGLFYACKSVENVPIRPMSFSEFSPPLENEYGDEVTMSEFFSSHEIAKRTENLETTI